MLGSLALSALVAALPLVLLFVLLGGFRVKAHLASIMALLFSILLAILVWQMPFVQAISAAGAGAFYGLFPILWILVNALWIYKLTEATGWFEVLGRCIRSLSNDLRVLSILIAFCFGALLEGLAGFGAPVAITVAMLIAAGMKPIKAGTVALLANTAPVAFGSMGTPIIALAGVTHIDTSVLSAMAGRQTPLIDFVVPFLLVFLVDGLRGVRQVWPVALVAGGVFAVVQFLVSNFVTVELTDVTSALITFPAVLLMLKVWQPKTAVEATRKSVNAVGTTSGDAAATNTTNAPFGNEAGLAIASEVAETESQQLAPTLRPPAKQVWYAVTPYLIIITVFSLAQLPPVKQWLNTFGGFSIQWPGLNLLDTAGNPLPAQTVKIDHIKSAGTLLLFSGLITALVYQASFKHVVKAYVDTLVQLKLTIVTVMAVLSLAYVMNLSGQTASIGLGLAATGGLFAVLSPVIGWIGVALTGSDTSSNSLFGALQVTAAHQTGLSPVLMAASNSTAGVLGKMLSVQNLAVAAAAIGIPGSEPILLRKLLKWSLILLALTILLVVLQSSVLSWMVPEIH